MDKVQVFWTLIVSRSGVNCYFFVLAPFLSFYANLFLGGLVFEKMGQKP